MTDFGRSFATRERAVEIAGQTPSGKELFVDFDGVVVLSPSFADEFVGELAERVEIIQFDNLSEELGSLMERTILRRGLGDRMRVTALA